MKTTRWTEALYLYDATIDGEPVRGLKCIAADEEEGSIECYFFSPIGEGVVRHYPDEDGNPRTYTRYGKVVITPPDPDRLERRAMRHARFRLST